MRTLLLVALGFFLAASPAMAEGSARKCVRTFDLREFQSLDDFHVLIRGRTSKELYLVTMRRSCHDIDNSTRLTTSFANKRTCPPFAEHIRTEDDLCPVRWITKVASHEDALALVQKDRAKKEIDAPAKAR